MTVELHAPGLRATWLNAWLAAIGATRLVDGLRLRWTDDATPHAVLSHPDDVDIVDALSTSLPTPSTLRAYVTANDAGQFPQTVKVETYARAAETVRQNSDDFTLSVLVTDLVEDVTEKLPTSPFNPGAPKGQTLWDRVMRCRELLEPNGERVAVEGSLHGMAVRVIANGLGWDLLGVADGDPPNRDKYVDPLIEFLAFFGLSLFPCRGDGGQKPLVRGWLPSSGSGSRRRTPRRFQWASWAPALDYWSIDALLGVLYSGDQRLRFASEFIERYEAVAYQYSGANPTRGFASVRV